jgi:hypothetical protein
MYVNRKMIPVPEMGEDKQEWWRGIIQV